MLDHIPHDNIIKPLRNIRRIKLLHIHREYLHKRSSNCRHMLIQLHAAEFGCGVHMPDLAQRRPAGTSDLQNAQPFPLQIHERKEILTYLKGIVQRNPPLSVE